MFIRDCPKCGKNISYCSKSNLNRANRSSKVCKSCAQEELKSSSKYSDRNKRISEKRIEYYKNIDSDEHNRQINKMKISLKKTYDNKSETWKNDWKKLCSKISKERWSDVDYKERVIQSMKDNNWTKREDYLDIIEKSLNTKLSKYGKAFFGKRCEEYKIGDLTCYGKTEMKYIHKLISESSELPKNFHGALKTPYGTYNPDFELNGYLIEVKSDFTFDVLLGRKSYSKSKPSNPLQLKKILWVSKNVKPVLVRVVTNSSVLEYDYDYLINFDR